MKKFISVLLLLSITLILPTMLSADDCVDVDNLFEPDLGEISKPQAPLPGSLCTQITALDILQLITPDPGEVCEPIPGVCPRQSCIINLPALLQEDLYLKTTGPVTRRALVDEPSLRYYCLDNCCWRFIIHPFYNYTPRVFFTKDSPFIRCYINLTNQNIINQINAAVDLACEKGVDIPGLLGLFQTIKIMQHRPGAMLGICKTFDNLSLSFRIPIYFLLEHFFLTDNEIEQIQNASTRVLSELGITGELSSKDQLEQFGRCHLVTDRLGFGDSRLNALYKIYETERVDMWVGLQATIPTSKTWTSGIIGAKFSSCQPVPDFNIKQLFQLYLCPTNETEQREANRVIQEKLTNFLIGALDRLSTIIINSPLGNGRHFGVGPQLDFQFKLNNCWYMHTFAAVEGFTKHEEDRFFLARKNPQDFNRNFRDPDQAEENLAFLNEQVINTLFPTPFRVKVRPGFLTKFAHTFNYDDGRMHGFVGFDYWHMGHEKIFVNDAIIKKFDTDKVTRPPAQQGKIFFSIGYRGPAPYDTTHYNCLLWDISFTGDATIFHKGIGENYTIGFKFGLNF